MKLPPCDLDSEMALLGAMMADRKCIDEARLSLPEGAEAFSTEAHRLIWASLCDVHDRNVRPDLISVTSDLRASGRFERVGGQEYLIQVAESFADTANAPFYATSIREMYRRRRIIQIGDAISNAAYDQMSDSETILGRLAGDIDALSVPGGGDAGELMDDVAAIPNQWRENREVWISSPLSPLTGMGMFEVPSFVIVGARPSCGKTSFGLACCLAAVAEERPCLFLSLETKRNKLAKRVAAIVSGKSLKRLRADHPDDQGFSFGYVARRLSHASVTVMDRVRSIRDIVSAVRTFVRTKGVKMVIIDHLQLIETDRRYDNRNLEMAAISRALHFLSNDTETVIVALSQLSREGAVRVSLATLRDSGALEQDADLVLLLQSNDPLAPKADAYGDPGTSVEGDVSYRDKSDIDIIVAKNRDGATGVVKTALHKSVMTFTMRDDATPSAVKAQSEDGVPW